MNNYHPYITGARRETTAADRLDVFGPGTDPAGLGTLGAPVNTAHVFEYLGENLPPFGNPQDVVGAGASSWEQGMENVYGGKYITEEQDRFSPNTKTITISDPTPVIAGIDELTVVKNNAQIQAEKMHRTARSYVVPPKADVLASRVNADAEMRNLQNEAVALVYESQMDAIRAQHLGAQARGAAMRGEKIGAMVNRPTTMVQRVALKPMVTSKVTLPATSTSKPTVMVPPSSTTTAAQQTESTSVSYEPEFAMGEPVSDAPITETYVDTRFEPTKVALVLGAVAAVAVGAFFFMRKR